MPNYAENMKTLHKMITFPTVLAFFVLVSYDYSLNAERSYGIITKLLPFM